MNHHLTHRMRHLSATVLVATAAVTAASSAPASAATLPPNPCIQYVLRCVLQRPLGQPVTTSVPAARTTMSSREGRR